MAGSGGLRVEDVGVSFGGNRVLDAVTFTAERGAVTALLGPNGAGKTTLFNVISGVVVPDRGTVHWAGERIDGLVPWRLARLGVSRSFQDPRLFPRLTAIENVVASLWHTPADGLGAAFRLRRGAAAAERDARRAAGLALRDVGMEAHAGTLAGRLSFAEQRMVSLAQIIAPDPGLVLLDEPSVGLDAEQLDGFTRLVRGLAERDKAVVLIEHNVEFVVRCAHRVLVLVGGVIVADGSPTDVWDNPVVMENYLGTRADAS